MDKNKSFNNSKEFEWPLFYCYGSTSEHLFFCFKKMVIKDHYRDTIFVTYLF